MQIPPPKKNPHINICLHLDNIHVRTHFFTMHVFIQKKAVYMNIVYAISPFFIMFTTQSPIIGIFLGRFVGLLRQSTYVDLMPTEAQRKPIAGWWRAAPIDRVLLTKRQTQNWYRQAKCQHQKPQHCRKLYKQLLNWLKCIGWQFQ